MQEPAQLSEAPRLAPGPPAFAGAPFFWRFIGLLLAGLLILTALLSLPAIASYIRIKRPMTFPESAVVYGTVEAALAEPVYCDWRQWPHRFAPYGPLLYYPLAWVLRTVDAPPFDFRFYLFGRVQSLVALCGIGLILTGLSRRLGAGRMTSIACGAGMMVLWPPLIAYLSSYRADAPMLFWNLLAVWIALGGLAARRRRWLVLGCLWLALLYKVSGWAAPLSVGFIAWRSIGRKPALRWGTLYLLGSCILFLALRLMTSGLSSLNIFQSQMNGFAWPDLLAPAATESWLDRSLVNLRLCLILPAGGWLLARRREETAVRALGLYAVLSLVFSLIQRSKVGADINYFAEPFFLVGPIAGWFWTAWRTFTLKPSRPAWVLATLLLLVAWPARTSARSYHLLLRESREMLTRRFAATEMDRIQEPALLMDTAFLHPDPAAHAIPDPFHYAVMLGHGRLSPEPLASRLESGEFDIVAFSVICRTAFESTTACHPLLSVLRTHYAQERTVGEVTVWKRRDDAPAGEATGAAP